MRKKGFTLIELLAVITILAIILLIAVPIVLRLTKDLKKSTAKESFELYGRAVENAVANYFMNNSEEDDVSIGILQSQNLIQYKGTKVQCEEVLIRNKQVYMSGCKVGEEYIEDTYGDFTPMGTLVSDTNPNEKISRGDKYKYKVNSEDEFNFYVLSIEGDKVNLIMDRNICEDGKPATVSNLCTVAWYVDEDDDTLNDNTRGPVTAMTYLYNATKKWYNVPNMIMDYEDEGNKTRTSGYISIATDLNTMKTTITGKSTDIPVSIATIGQPLKARLPKIWDLFSVEEDNEYCQNPLNSCPEWITNGLEQYSTYYSNNDHILGIKGYWLLGSYDFSLGNAMAIYFPGTMNPILTSNDNEFGIRPVITVSKLDLSK